MILRVLVVAGWCCGVFFRCAQSVSPCFQSGVAACPTPHTPRAVHCVVHHCAVCCTAFRAVCMLLCPTVPLALTARGALPSLSHQQQRRHPNPPTEHDSAVFIGRSCAGRNHRQQSSLAATGSPSPSLHTRQRAVRPQAVASHRSMTRWSFTLLVLLAAAVAVGVQAAYKSPVGGTAGQWRRCTAEDKLAAPALLTQHVVNRQERA